MAVIAKAQDIFLAFPLVFFLAPFFTDPEEGQSKQPYEDIYDKAG